MHSILRSVQRRESGALEPVKYEKYITRNLGTALAGESRSFFSPTILGVSYTDVVGNRLLAVDHQARVLVYDVTPSTDSAEYKAVGLWTILCRSTMPCCRWATDCSFFTVSGRKNALNLIDAQYIVEIDCVEVPACEAIFIHAPSLYNSSTVAAGCDDGVIAVVDFRTGHVAQSTKCCNGHIYGLSWSPLEEHIVVTASDSDILIWDTRQYRKAVATLPPAKIPHSKNIVAYNKFVDGNHLLTLQRSNGLSLYNVCSRELVQSGLGLRAKTFMKRCKFDVCPDGKLLYCQDKKDLVVTDLKTGSQLSVLKGHIYPINIVEFNELSKEVYTFSDDESLIWSPVPYQS